jgi:hypothetical protein
MNERMLELYKQAQVSCTAIDPSNNMPYETTCFSADKFAELIVKDCADFVRESYDHAGAEGIAWYMEIKYGLHGDYA